VCCPNCGEGLALAIEASLPATTDLTVSLKVEPGQLMRLDTMAGVMSSWRELQIAVGKSLETDTEVFLADMGQRDNEFWFTGRIINGGCDSDRSGEAGETHSGSTEGESADPEGIAPEPSA
jgi:hypothetical protein